MRREIFLAIPILGLAVMLQLSIISRTRLLDGAADLVLVVLAAWGLQEKVRSAWIWGLLAGLTVGAISGVAWYVYLSGYLLVVGAARLLARRIWQAPLLAMFSITLAGSLLIAVLVILQRTLTGIPFSNESTFTQVILPSVLLNLLLGIPVHALLHRLAGRLYPEELRS